MRTIYSIPLETYLKNPQCTLPSVSFTPRIEKIGMWMVTFRSSEHELGARIVDDPKDPSGRPLKQRRWGYTEYFFSVPFSVVPKDGESEDAIHRAAMAIFAYKNYPGVGRLQAEIVKTEEKPLWPWTQNEVSFHSQACRAAD